MRLEAFFEKFELFADAPNAIAKMREFILQLAVQGQLVERFEKDGSAAQTFVDGDPVKGERRYEIPKTWIWIRFSAVGEQRLGKMLDQKGNRGELKPYLRNTNVQWMRFQLDDIKELRLGSEELDEFRLRSGDLLICEGGEPGRCAIWRDQCQEMYFQKAIHRVRPRDGILSEYLAVCLQVDAKNGVLDKNFTGATIKHFTGRSLREYSIPLPPLAEQKRIVAKVDELMALCDRLEAQQQERQTRYAALARASLSRFAEAPTPANLDFLFHDAYAIDPADLRKSILTLAVQGKLVPQNPDDEHAASLFERIRARKRGSRNKDAIHEEHEFASPFELPSGWIWSQWDRIALKIGDIDHMMPAQVSEGIPYVSPRDFMPANRIDFEGAKRISRDDYLRLAAKIKPEVGDLIYPRYGTIGENRLVTVAREFLASYSCAVIKTMPELIDARYQYFFSISEFCREQARSAENKTTQANVGIKSIKEFLFPIPPLAEQHRIVAKVDQLMGLVDRLEAQLAASRTAAANLLEAVVAELTALN